jgi:hypothetical protein
MGRIGRIDTDFCHSVGTFYETLDAKGAYGMTKHYLLRRDDRMIQAIQCLHRPTPYTRIIDAKTVRT